MDLGLQGRCALVTGGSMGIGRAAALELAAEGCRVAIAARGEEALARAADDIRARAHAEVINVRADCTRPEDIARMVEEVAARFGRIDILVNSIGAARSGHFLELPEDDWRASLELKLYGVIRCCRAVVPHMLSAGGGAIVNVGANSAARGLAQMGAYCASKDALARVTESMSAELRDLGIRVNAVLPSILDTPENRQAMPDADTSRWVALDALADVILFLASDAARAVQGALVPVVNRA